MSRLALLAALLACAGAAPAADWTVQPEGSSLRFSGVAQGEKFEGRFKEFTPAIRFDPAALEASRFDVTVKLASADSLAWSARGRNEPGCEPGHATEANCLSFALSWRAELLSR
jgi:hypothetical protein